jgi:tetratricopeptide (TPR) repeat protein
MLQPDPSLPKSLQSMILEAQAARSQTKPAEEPDSEYESILRAVDEWYERLAHGEYDQALYWRCAAEDCEEVGDWNGAIEAHKQILISPDASDVDRSRAHSEIASIQCVLGDDDGARESFHLASMLARPFSDVLCRHYLCNEAMHLCRIGRADEARQLVDEVLAAHEKDTREEDTTTDHLGMGKVLTVLARCELAKADLQSARESLDVAWQWLEALRQSYGEDESMNGAVGLISSFAAWWQVSAQLSELNDDGNAAIEALFKARELATQCAEHSGWSRYDFDYYQMQVLRKLAVALSRADRFGEANEAMQKAIEIQVRRKFPVCRDPRP